MPTRKILPEKKRKTVGIALGGGSAKGLAHIGVIKALREINIPIDYIAGTSMGAIIGGWYALEGDIASVEEFIFTLKKEERKELAKISFRKGRARMGDDVIVSIINRRFGSKQFKDCKIPFVAVATDVKTGDEVVISEGGMADAIRASSALPVIFEPVKIGNRVLVDGGIANPVPADIVRQMGADIVIATDVLSKWVDISLLSEGTVTIRNIRPLFSAIISLLSYQVAKEKLEDADVIIKPPVSGYKMLDFRDAEKIIAAGYRETRAHYADICRLTDREQPKKHALDEFWEFVFGLDQK